MADIQNRTLYPPILPLSSQTMSVEQGNSQTFRVSHANGQVVVHWRDLSGVWAWSILLAIVIAALFVKTYLDKDLPVAIFHTACLLTAGFLIVLIPGAYYRLELSNEELTLYNGVRLFPGVPGRRIKSTEITGVEIKQKTDYSDFDANEWKVLIETTSGNRIRIGSVFEKGDAEYLCNLLRPFSKGLKNTTKASERLAEILFWSLLTAASAVLIGLSGHENLDYSPSTNMRILGSLLSMVFFTFIFFKTLLPFRGMEPSRIQAVMYIICSIVFFAIGIYGIYFFQKV